MQGEYICNIKKDGRFSEFYFKYRRFKDGLKRAEEEFKRQAAELTKKFTAERIIYWNGLIEQLKGLKLVDKSVQNKTHTFDLDIKSGELRLLGLTKDLEEDPMRKFIESLRL